LLLCAACATGEEGGLFVGFHVNGVILGAGAGRLSWQWAIDNPPVLEEEQSFSRNIHWIRYFLSRIIKMLSFSFVILAFLARFI
jgi:hypothetical protein